VLGKGKLWEALLATRADDPKLEGVDLAALAARARSQHDRLEELRRTAARESLGP
jgi:hypothetical protein